MSPQEKIKAQKEKYLQLVDLRKLVAGVALGNELALAERVAKALDQRDKGCDDFIELHSHLVLAKHAKALKVDSIGLLPARERQERLTALVPHMPSMPKAWCGAILCCAVKDFVLSMQVDSEEWTLQPAKWLSMVMPRRAEPGCQARKMP